MRVDLLLMALLTVLNGAFAMSEMAISASRKARLAALQEAGDAGAAKAIELMDSPTRFLSTVQIGITSIGMVNGIVGEAAFSGPLEAQLAAWGMAQKWASIAATGVVVTVITFTTIVFGELVPKRIGQLFPEAVARVVSRPMGVLAKVAKPFVHLLAITTLGTLKLLRVDVNAAREVTEEEIAASLEEGVDAGVIEAHEHQMVRNVFHLDDRALSSLMVPRGDMLWLDASKTVSDAVHWAGANGHSWYPVCRGSLDDVLGVVSIHQLIEASGQESTRLAEAGQMAQPAIFVPESLSGMELLEQFRKNAARLVFVVDEYGVVQGLLTPRDLLEAITGELRPNAPLDAWATQRADGSWLLDGLMPVGEFKTRLEIKELPDEDKGRYNTVGGLWLSVAGRLPQTADAVDCEGWRLEVVDLDGRRIDKLLAQKVALAGASALLH